MPALARQAPARGGEPAAAPPGPSRGRAAGVSLARQAGHPLPPRPRHQRMPAQCPRHPAATARAPLAPLPPASNGDADPELWQVLELCDDDELECLHEILWGTSLLSPIVKSLAADNEPPAVALRGRAALMRRIDGRFRFLAADAGDTVAGRRPTYREALLRLRDRLGVQCPGGLATPDLEAEILLHALAEAGEAAPPPAAAAVEEGVAVRRAGEDGLARRPSTPPPPPPPSSSPSSSFSSAEAAAERQARHAARRTRVAAARALRLPGLAVDAVAGALSTAAKFGGAAALGRAGTAALRRLAGSAAGRRAAHEAALAALHRAAASSAAGSAASTAGAAAARRAAAVRAAQAGAASAAARYGAARGALAALSAASWVLLAADLAVKAVGTDYARLSRAVVALAQVRLLKTYGWASTGTPAAAGGGGGGGGGGRPPAANA